MSVITIILCIQLLLIIIAAISIVAFIGFAISKKAVPMCIAALVLSISSLLLNILELFVR